MMTSVGRGSINMIGCSLYHCFSSGTMSFDSTYYYLLSTNLSDRVGFGNEA